MSKKVKETTLIARKGRSPNGEIVGGIVVVSKGEGFYVKAVLSARDVSILLKSRMDKSVPISEGLLQRLREHYQEYKGTQELVCDDLKTGLKSKGL